jgi:phosphonate dehydrogenase
MLNTAPPHPKVLLTHWVHPEVLERLREHCEVVANDSKDSWPANRLRELASDCDAAIMFMPDSVDEAFLAGCPRLKIIAAALKGADNFDVEACTRRGIWFARVPDLLTVPTAELAIGLTLAVMRRMRVGDGRIRGGNFRGWRPVLYGDGLAGKTVGMIGMGAVGRAIAQRLAGFDVDLIYSDPVPVESAFASRWRLERANMEGLLSRSDVVMPLTHLTQQTFHMIDATAIGGMKPGAWLVNVGRGSLVDEAAVAEALARGQLAGYAADVFEMEDWALPIRPWSIDARLLDDTERTFFTPHLGSAVDSVRRDIAMYAADSVLDWLRGERPRGAINAIY